VTYSETRADVRAAAVAEHAAFGLQWSAIIAGTVAAAALAFVLHSFAGAIGISVSSTAPTWRDASFALVLVSGLYVLLVAIAAYGFGGYVAARVRARFAPPTAEDIELNDGMHGLVVWALATLLTGLLALAVAEVLPRLAAPSATTAGPATSVAGENIIAFDLDRLLRGGERRPAADLAYARAEAARILMTTASHNGMQADDRAYLVRLVSAETGLAPPDAERRVTDTAAAAQADINRARRSAIVLGFMTGAAALVGAAIAWAAACVGGRHRDGREAVPSWLAWGRIHARA
jgi:hypothetical protein